MPDALIYDAVRTPRGRGKKSGSLYPVRPVELLAGVLRSVRDRSGLDTSEVDDVVAGCVTQTGEQGACIARAAVLEAGWDHTAAGVTLTRFCGSGLEAVNQAAARIASGFEDCIVAGGVESMSRVPMGSDGGAMVDVDAQWNTGFVPQGISADLIGTLHGYTRSDVDAFAAESQRRAANAWERGAFKRSIVPVVDAGGIPYLDHDEHMRPSTTAESLGKLTPSFLMMGEQFGLDTLVRKAYPQVERVNHIHHAGNSSGIVDGAAAVLLASREKGRSLGLGAPRARVRSIAVTATEPLIMLTGPVPAAQKALKKAGMTVDDIDLFEVNEAFAVVPLYFMHQLGIPHDKVNVEGGAIALGHPLGATGAMLLGTVLNSLEDRNLNTALITLCIGGGMGVATIIERV